MGIAAGGFIKQAIVEDSGKREWDTTQTKVFNVQVLNSHHFRAVTGFGPQASCVTAEIYAGNGYPFYSMCEESTVVAGNFNGVQSVGQLEGIEEAHVVPLTISLGSMRITSNPLEFLHNHPSFRMAVLVLKQHPQMLEPMLQQIQDGNPKRAQYSHSTLQPIQLISWTCLPTYQ